MSHHTHTYLDYLVLGILILRGLMCAYMADNLGVPMTTLDMHLASWDTHKLHKAV